MKQDSFSAVTASLSALKRLRDEVFMARSFLCSNALWSSLDTSILLGCIRKSCNHDTTDTTVCSIDALVVQTQIYDHLHSGLIQGHISDTDLDESNFARCVTMFLELFQIINELSMIERRESEDKVSCQVFCLLAVRYCSHHLYGLEVLSFIGTCCGMADASFNGRDALL